MTIGNLLYFYLGIKGREILTLKYEKQIKRLLRWIENRPWWAVQLFIFFYVGFTPFPNNLLTTSGGITGIDYKTMTSPLLLGNIALMTWISYLATLGIRLF